MPPAVQGWRPGQGIVRDLARRLPHYRSDWVQGFSWRTILPPATFIFFASVLPALAFGQQLATDTEGTLNVVHVLVSTALSGIVQAVVGGQPLLIIGVAEPIVIIYGFMYSFARSSGLGVDLFLPWAAWVCIFTALLCCLLAVVGACEGISYFTRFSGELFGALIAILFLQVGIKGIVHEFQPPASQQQPGSSSASSPSSGEPWELTLINGLWSLLLSLALLLSCLAIRKARSWRVGRSWLRGFCADYGVPLMVVLWSGVSFCVTPSAGVPRRVTTPNTWEVRDTWATASRLSQVPAPFIAAALLPAIIITVLFYFDHNVSSQLAQQPEFNLAKGPAYHWDFLLLSALTLLCGLLGLPPVNGVLPQAPMHTRSLAHIPKQPRHSHATTAAAQHPPANNPEGCTIHSDSDSEIEWGAADSYDSQGVHAEQQAIGGPPAVADVTQSLSQLQLGGRGDTHSTGRQLQPLRTQQQDGVRSLTTALTHMHLDDHPIETDSPSFGTPTAAQQAASSVFQPAAATSTSTAAGLSLRHRQRSLSPTASKDAAAAASSAPQRRCALHVEQQQQQQQQQPSGRGQGRLHPSGSDVAINTLPDSAAAAVGANGGLEVHAAAATEAGAGGKAAADAAAQGSYIRLEVREQRVSNLLQSLLVAACLGITPAIKQIPTGVLWGFFIFMAVESLQGSQLWERLLLLLTDSKKRVEVLQQEHAAYMQLVPYRVVVRFTLLQLVYLLGVWALTTFAGVAGIAFPLPIMALVPVRQFVLPRLFDRTDLRQLDAAEYEEAPPVPDRRRAAQELYELSYVAEAPAPELPVTATTTAVSGGDGVLAEDEADLVSREFHGLQIKHHLTRESLEQQRQHQRRQ